MFGMDILLLYFIEPIKTNKALCLSVDALFPLNRLINSLRENQGFGFNPH
jgi:hypothetical protein